MHTTTILRNRNIIVSFGLQPKHLGINWTMSPQKPEKIKQQSLHMNITVSFGLQNNMQECHNNISQ